MCDKYDIDVKLIIPIFSHDTPRSLTQIWLVLFHIVSLYLSFLMSCCVSTSILSLSSLESRTSQLLEGATREREVWSNAHIQVVDSARNHADQSDCNWLGCNLVAAILCTNRRVRKKILRDLLLLLILHYRFQWSHNYYYTLFISATQPILNPRKTIVAQALTISCWLALPQKHHSRTQIKL